MHLFQTNNTTQTRCLVRETGSWNHVENTPGHEKLSRTCLAYLWHFWCLRVCICVCLWSQSDTNAPSAMRHGGSAPFDPRQHKEKAQPQNKGLQKGAAQQSRRFPRKQPSDTCITMNIAPLCCCQRASDFHKEFSFEGTWKRGYEGEGVQK